MGKGKMVAECRGFIAGKSATKMADKAGKKVLKAEVLKPASAKSKATAKSAPKTKAKAAGKDPKLDATRLAQHQQKFKDMSLDDKLAYMKDKTPGEIKELSKDLSKLDKSKLWNRHNTACQNNPDLKTTRDGQTGRVAKGLLSLSWNLDPALGDLYESLTKTITVSEKLKRHAYQFVCHQSICVEHKQFIDNSFGLVYLFLFLISHISFQDPEVADLDGNLNH